MHGSSPSPSSISTRSLRVLLSTSCKKRTLKPMSIGVPLMSIGTSDRASPASTFAAVSTSRSASKRNRARWFRSVAMIDTLRRALSRSERSNSARRLKEVGSTWR